MPLPEASVAGDPHGGVLHGSGDETAAAEPTLSRAGEEPGGFKHSQVLRDGGERDIEGAGQLGDRRLSLREPGENCSPRGIRQSGERCIERPFRIVNHMVNYRP